jgi:hypothetical protein
LKVAFIVFAFRFAWFTVNSFAVVPRRPGATAADFVPLASTIQSEGIIKIAVEGLSRLWCVLHACVQRVSLRVAALPDSRVH